MAVWLLLWQLGAMALNQKILLVSPVQVLLRLGELLPQGGFWGAVGFSFWRITLGFLLACAAGTALGVLSSRFWSVRDLCAPLMATVKSIPVASFIILVLIWVPSRNLSIIISFLMVTPIVYQNVLGGISSMDRKLTEMADVFEVPFPRRLRYLYLPQVMPFFRSACAVGLGPVLESRGGGGGHRPAGRLLWASSSMRPRPISAPRTCSPGRWSSSW